MEKFEFIFMGSWKSSNSYSWVHMIFMNIFMGSQLHIHRFIGLKAKKFMVSQYEIHGFPDLNSWVPIFFMNNIHTTHEHIHGDYSW